jgi:peptide/nickel transport system substrate-binding protein
MRHAAIAALCFAALATGCSKETASQGGQSGNSWTKPHVLTYGDFGDVTTLNTHLAQFADTQYIGQLTGAWLIRWDEHNGPYPELATEIPTTQNGGVSADGLSITYHLRRGVKWSDGAPFSADDVVFSTHVVLNPANNEIGRLGWNQITKIDEPDKYTVVYHLSKPYSPFIETFFSTAGANPSILPKHLLAQYPNINNVPYNEKPIGIGPFVVDRWDRGSQVVMSANPLYWRGRPKLDQIVFKIIPDRNTLLAQLESHEIDLWPLVAPAYLKQAQQIQGYSVLRQPSYLWNHFDFNTTRPGMNDVVVRQALRYATNRRELRDKIGHGVGTLAEVPTPLSAPYAVRGVPLVPFDLARANELLDKDGWVRGADGVRAKGGARLSFSFVTTAGSQDVDNLIALIQQDWQKIGVVVTVKHVPASLLFAPAESGGVIYGTNWDVATFAWQNEAIGDYSQLYSCAAFPPNGQNDPRWCNHTADAAMHALYAHYDQTERNADVAVFAREFAHDVPVLIYTIRNDIFAYNSDLKNYHPNGVSIFDNFMDVDI